MNKKAVIKQWLNFAKQDLRDAEILFDKKSYKGCIYHCHQATEKHLKALLISRNKKVRKTHDLADLLKGSEIKYTVEILQFIHQLNPYYDPIRYPDVALDFPLKYDRKTAEEILKSTKEISKWLIFHLNQKK